MAPTSSYLTLLAIFSLLILFLSPSIQASPNDGFSVELIHRDSPKSPFYDPNETPYQRIHNALRRSRSRIQQFQEPKSVVWSNNGEYLMNISIGTPPFEIIAVADTGSELIWTQCKPCNNCFKQERPMFDPKYSKTYRDLACSSQVCRNQTQPICKDHKCEYAYSYDDGSNSTGLVATETITLSSTSGLPVSLPGSVFGCGHNSGGLFSNKSSGVIGLDGGPFSLISQLDHLIHGKFSYCLVPYFSEKVNSSTMLFGPHSFPKGPGVQSTPLFFYQPFTFYLLSLESFSVGNTTIKMTGFLTPPPEDDALLIPNIVIDSGTTLTYIPEDVFRNLSAAVDKLIDAKRAKDPNRVLSLCYAYNSFKFEEAPTIIAHFSGGADFKLVPLNTFIKVSDDVVCFAITSSKSLLASPSIFGNIAQMNHLVAYDLKGMTVSFKQTDCSKM